MVVKRGGFTTTACLSAGMGRIRAACVRDNRKVNGSGHEHSDDDEAPRRGIFIGLSAGTSGSAGSALGGGFSALDAVFNPGAARAREELDRQNEAVLPTPSPGDRMLDENRIVISLPAPEDDAEPD